MNRLKSALLATAGLCLLFLTGCETRDYEPLKVKKKLQDLEQEVESLKQEINELKTGGVAQAQPSSRAPVETLPAPRRAPDAATQLVSETPEPMAPAGPSVAEEESICLKLESLDAFFEVDDDGHVKEVDLKECRQTNEALEQVATFSRLSRVLLDGNQTDEKTFEILGQIHGLAYLDIERSTPSAASFEKLKGLPKLTFLQLFKATLSEDAVRVLSEFPALEQIRCAQTRVGDDELKHLANLKTLRAIDLSDCNRVTPSGLQSLAQCPRLSFLKVWGKSIDNASMEIVATMKSLRVLGLNDTAVNDEGIAKLAGLNLSEIHVARTSVGDEGVRVLAAMSNLGMANLRDTKISDLAMQYFENTPKLRKLDLSECTSPGITDVAAASIAKFQNLEDLNLWSTNFSDEALRQIQDLPKLTRLNLDANPITDASADTLAKMKQLTWIHLGKTKITDKTVPALKQLENLRHLDISFTEISQDAYYELDDLFQPLGCELIGP